MAGSILPGGTEHLPECCTSLLAAWSSPSFAPGCLHGRGRCSQPLHEAGSLQLGPGTTAGRSSMDQKQLSKGIVVFEAFIPSGAESCQAEVPSFPPEVSGKLLEQVDWCRSRMQRCSPPGTSMWYQNRSGSVLDVRHCVTPMPLGTNPLPKPQWDREETRERLSCSLHLR